MSTQILKAKSGVITSEMEVVAKSERVTPEWLRNEIAMGRVVIPKNINHKFSPRSIGKGLSIKVNAKNGTSEKNCNLT